MPVSQNGNSNQCTAITIEQINLYRYIYIIYRYGNVYIYIYTADQLGKFTVVPTEVITTEGVPVMDRLPRQCLD